MRMNDEGPFMYSPLLTIKSCIDVGLGCAKLCLARSVQSVERLASWHRRDRDDHDRKQTWINP